MPDIPKFIDALQKETSKLEERLDEQHELIHSLKTEVEKLKMTSEKNEGRWNKIMGFVIQLAWVLLAAYLLYQLNLQNISIP